MQSNHRSTRSPSSAQRVLLLRSLAATTAIALQLPLVAQAQTVAGQDQVVDTGGLRGRVLNTATGGYVRNAEIRVEGTPIVGFPYHFCRK